jgi:integrase
MLKGIRYRRSTGTANRHLAEKMDRKHYDELFSRQNQLEQFNPSMTLGELTAKFIAEGHSKAWHLDRLKALLPVFSDTAIGNIGRSQIKQYRVRRHQEKTLTETTINRDLECLRHILFWAVDEGFLFSNPLSRMKLERERKKKRQVLSLIEEELLLNAAAPHLYELTIAALDSGMRRGELLQQEWKDVDFARKLLFVSHSKTAEGECREIPLTGRFFDLLWNKRQDQGLVFTYKGQGITRIKTAWKAAIRRAGIRYLRFHDLRHSFNTRLMEAGVMQEVRKALMGHSSGEDVHATYTHVELPLKREAIRKLEEWRNQQAEKILKEGEQ